MQKEKLGIIVPYRDRPSQLRTFKKKIIEYFKDINISYEIIIVEQDEVKLFNRGILLNIGFKYAIKYNCDYVVFHDIDMIPIEVDYSYSEVPLHLSTDFICDDQYKKVLFDEYFGGVTMFTVDVFKQINGYSNNYWGWGFEDDDLLLRCKNNSIQLNTKSIENIGKSKKMINLNGVNSYITGKNKFNFDKDLTLFISFCPNNLTYNHKKEIDNYTIFSIPGYDFSISYNSFSRYCFTTFNDKNEVLYINTDIKTNYKTNITITINSKENEIIMYQDGEFVNSIKNYNKLHDYSEESFFYIGGDPTQFKDKNCFIGYFDMLGVFSKCIDSDEVYQMSNNRHLILNRDSLGYNSYKELILGYDTKNIKNYKLVDLSGNENDGIIMNSSVEYVKMDKQKEIKIPHRRKSTFLLLQHEENGFLNNRWKYKSTRWNQLRFFNEVSKNLNILKTDGLSNLQYVVLNEKKTRNVTQIKVGVWNIN